MATNKTRLDQGQPAIPDPPALTDDAKRYGNALAGAWGKEGAATQWGTYLRRIPVTVSSVSVAANQATTAEAGLVTDVTATTGTFTGAVKTRVGPPATEECGVEYNADGTATLTFAAGDAVTECAYTQLQTPADLVAHLDATTDPA